MTWMSHRVTAFVTALAITVNPVSAGLAALTVSVPDRVEPWTGKFHRTWGHWPFLWLSVLILLYSPEVWDKSWTHWTSEEYLFWMFTGPLFHIAGDSVCGNVPIFHPMHRIKVFPRFFTTGSVKEYVFVIVYALIMVSVVSLRLYNI